MLQHRIIPSLQIQDGSIVKSVKFKDHMYIGDPVNTVNIYNNMEVDELIIVDISSKKDIKYDLIEDIASECFMPLTYGGGITTIEEAKKIFSLGVEKIVIGEKSFDNFIFLNEISKVFGSQSIAVSMDIKKNMFGTYQLKNKNNFHSIDISEYIKNLENSGVGEILLTSINNDGTFKGMDLELIKQASKDRKIPLIASGGVASIMDIKKGINAGASAVAVGSMAVFQNHNRSVLINFPQKIERQKYGI
jgi:imidazole glycerol-phosphate synthase subunit HisF